MSITPGYTTAQIREFVYEYERLPHGTKQEWIDGQTFSRWQMRRWQAAVFGGGDLDRGIIPRQGMSMPSSQEFRRRTAKDDVQARQAAEITRLEARVRELEGTNEALGKAIGLLHQLNEHEPDTGETNGPNGS